MTRRKLVVLAITVMTAAACSRGGGAPPMLVDARRVVSVAPATTEALFAIGAGGRVVGRSRFCDWPPEATKLPTVGGFVDADLEAILQLRPDLVVGAPGPLAARLGEKLSARGVATWFPETDSLASIDAMVVGMGDRTGRAAAARQVVDDIDARERAIERAVASEPLLRVLMVLGVAPVVAAGPRSFADELIRRARGTNVLTDGGAWQTVGFETIVEIEPDVVVDASVGVAGSTTRITSDAPGWRDVTAAREGRVVALADPRVLRPGPRIAEGLALLARGLHPSASVPTW